MGIRMHLDFKDYSRIEKKEPMNDNFKDRLFDGILAFMIYGTVLVVVTYFVYCLLNP
jgi:hypothetical protein